MRTIFLPALLFGTMLLLLWERDGALALAASASAAESGVMTRCESCHLTGSPGEGTIRLKGSDASSTCLLCHKDIYRVLSTDGSVYAPGGDFYWLRKSYEDGRNSSPGESHGHNVVALDFGLFPDPKYQFAPAAFPAYRSAWLGCTSCHDPHGGIGSMSVGSGYGSYRMLGGIGYQGGGEAMGFSFKEAAPVARGYDPRPDGRWPPETDRNHVDYGSGMSEWCANCHAGYDNAFPEKHPAGRDALLGSIADTYNAYRATGDNKGDEESAFDRLVPFERGVADARDLDPTSTAGPDAHANVMCLSCHRAHATPFRAIGRWDFETTFLADSPVLRLPDSFHVYFGEDVETRYGKLQRSLCNKCHHQDCVACHRKN